MADLTPQQRRFVEAYLGPSGKNATDAARRAKYHHPSVAGCRLLRNVNVLAEIAVYLKAAGVRVGEHLHRLDDTAKGDLGDFVRLERGDLKVSLPKAKTRLLRKLKQGQFGIEIELHDPIRAIQVLLGYHTKVRFLRLLKRKIEGKPDEFRLSDLTADAEVRAEQRKKERK